MRSAILAAAFAASAIAVPHQKRVEEVVTDYDVVYVTDVVTITAGEEAPATSAAPSSSAAATQVAHYGHHSWWSSAWTSVYTSTPEASSAAPTTTSVAPAPTSTTESSTEAPAPTSYAAPSSAAPSSVWSSSAAPPPSSTSAAAAAPTSYEEITVYHHNIHRSNHSASDIVWNSTLADWAGSIASSCVYAHNVTAFGGGYGQNIAAGVESNNISAIITDLFYNGEVGWYAGLYGQAQPSMTNFENWGHFSQIVWKGTTSVGCATQDCSSSGLGNVGSDVSPYFTVCNYGPPGNYANEYGDNIGEPKGDPTANWNTGL